MNNIIINKSIIEWNACNIKSRIEWNAYNIKYNSKIAARHSIILDVILPEGDIIYTKRIVENQKSFEDHRYHGWKTSLNLMLLHFISTKAAKIKRILVVENLCKDRKFNKLMYETMFYDIGLGDCVVDINNIPLIIFK